MTARLLVQVKPAVEGTTNEVKALLYDERRRQKSHPAPPIANVPPARAVPAWRDFERELAEVRAHGLARSDGETLPGVA